jgi:hypothetical protein
MVLNGTITEFILADVFNLLVQQRITGRLALVDEKLEAGIVFKDGIIVGADCGDENLPNKLFNFLVDIKKIEPDQLTPLFNANSGNLSVLAASLLERNLMDTRELKSFTESCVEDICCSLLTWNKGTYRFSSLRGIATIACGVVTIPVENIIMEGMRRTDEWGRMQEYIREDMIFVPAKRAGGGGGEQKQFDLVNAQEEYILSLLDGSNTIKRIKKSGCLCEYKVYESINNLLQAQRITALHQKYTQPIHAALRRKNAEEASVLGKTFFGSLLSVGVAAAFVLFFLFGKMIVLPALTSDAEVSKNAGKNDAVQAAAQLHRATTGEELMEKPAALKKEKLLTGRDF